jgi:hypothetical protein
LKIGQGLDKRDFLPPTFPNRARTVDRWRPLLHSLFAYLFIFQRPALFGRWCIFVGISKIGLDCESLTLNARAAARLSLLHHGWPHEFLGYSVLYRVEARGHRPDAAVARIASVFNALNKKSGFIRA